jgi:beta-glucosidase
MEDIPPIEDYNMKGRTYRYSDKEPCFPFGFGLSYVDFEYKNLRLSTNQVKIGENITIDVDVVNNGKIEAEEVVQLYLKDMEASLPIPQYSLQGVKRLRLHPRQTFTAHFEITARQMAIINMEGKPIIEPGQFTVYVGGQQPDSKSEHLTGKKPVQASFEAIGKPLEVDY